MKKSDLKQKEKAQKGFYQAVKEMMLALDDLEDVGEGEISNDDYNQLAAKIKKLTNTLVIIKEKHIMRGMLEC